MAVALTFWQLPEEEEEFLGFLDTTGTIVAYPDHWVKTVEDTASQPIRRYFKDHDPRQCFLGLKLDGAAVVVGNKSQGAEQFLSIDLLASYLIAYSRPRFRTDNQLGQSNLAAYLQYPNSEGKPDWFKSWVKEVFRWVKRRAKKKCVHQGSAYPATSLVVKAVDEGRIEPVI